MNKTINFRSTSINFDYTDHQLQSLIIHNNNQAMNLLQDNYLNKVYSLLQQSNRYLSKIKKNAIMQKKAQSLTLNSWACYYYKKNLNQNALKKINEAVDIEQQILNDNLGLARTYLNKCVILSNMKNHHQAIIFANKAIQYLNIERKNLGNNRKRKRQISQIFAISFYNIASEFQHLKKNDSAIDAYTKGYNICRQMMGEKHKLTILMKNNLKSVNQNSLQKKSQRRLKTQLSLLNFEKKKQITTKQIILQAVKRLKRNRRQQVQNFKYNLIDSNKFKIREKSIEENSQIMLSRKLGKCYLPTDYKQDDQMKDIQKIKKIYLSSSKKIHQSFYKHKTINLSNYKSRDDSKFIAEYDQKSRDDIKKQSIKIKNSKTQNIIQFQNQKQIQIVKTNFLPQIPKIIGVPKEQKYIPKEQEKKAQKQNSDCILI